MAFAEFTDEQLLEYHKGENFLEFLKLHIRAENDILKRWEEVIKDHKDIIRAYEIKMNSSKERINDMEIAKRRIENLIKKQNN